MIRLNLARATIALVATTLTFLSFLVVDASAQRRRAKVQHLSVCGNPNLPCKTIATFEPNDLPFRLPAKAVIYDTELFYAVMLTSVKSPDDNCDVFVSERERLAAQALFPDHKVFSSRCTEPGAFVLHEHQRRCALYGRLRRSDFGRSEPNAGDGAGDRKIHWREY